MNKQTNNSLNVFLAISFTIIHFHVDRHMYTAHAHCTLCISQPSVLMIFPNVYLKRSTAIKLRVYLASVRYVKEVNDITYFKKYFDNKRKLLNRLLMVMLYFVIAFSHLSDSIIELTQLQLMSCRS